MCKDVATLHAVKKGFCKVGLLDETKQVLGHVWKDTGTKLRTSKQHGIPQTRNEGSIQGGQAPTPNSPPAPCDPTPGFSLAFGGELQVL